jgi:zona occludens toxin (predicted ATPase)
VSVTGVHTLVTGLNGHGKTLYTVAEKLRPLVGTKVEHEGREVERRLCIAGIPGLLLPHELVGITKLDPETWRDEWGVIKREAYQPPVTHVRRVSGGAWEACVAGDEGAQPLPWDITNWWLWCRPGDVIVVDECQRVFRPMPSGRRIPMFLEKLETARHYGVQFVYISQHPQQLHTNLRNLVGPHQHVRRIFGGVRTVIYEWDHCTHPDRIAAATKRFWKHDKSAFGLYESAQVHTKFGQRLPFAVFGVLAGVVLLAGLVWFLWGRLYGEHGRFGASGVAQPAAGAASAAGLLRGPEGRSGSVRPAGRPMAVGPVVVGREPYAGLGVHLAGWYVDAGVRRTFFSLSVDGRTVATLSERDVLGAGYVMRTVGPCAMVLVFGTLERPVTCDAPSVQVQRTERAQPAGSSASAPLV